jgi:predicted component of type VI protein secretion system
LPYAVEAICLLAALPRREAGCWASEPARWPTLDLLDRTDTSLAEEIAVLLRVAQYYRRYRRSRPVRALLAELRHAYPDDLAHQSPTQGVV